jgi:predicted ATP-dependent protease
LKSSKANCLAFFVVGVLVPHYVPPSRTAATREMSSGISTVIIPKLNEKDLVDVPEEAKQKLRFIPVENVDEVLAVALGKNGAPSASERKSA